MNQRLIRFIALLVPVALLLGACQSETQKFVPITGSNNDASSMPARVSLARGHVLEYVVASRLVNVPDAIDWELEDGNPAENGYRFRSGDWLMVIAAVNSDEENQRVVLLNQVESIFWSGYFTPDQRVVDTTYGR